MKQLFTLTIALFCILQVNAQLDLSGFGLVKYNQSFKSGETRNGEFWVDNFSLLGSFTFNEKTRFASELSFGERVFGEHKTDVYFNQLYLSHEIKSWLKFKAGVLLLPVGLINEYRDPTSHAGVERPLIDFLTLRGIGLGFSGAVEDYNIKYQAYLVNGYNSAVNTDDGIEGTLIGPLAYFQGRQEMTNAKFRTPAIALKAEHYGIKGLKVGASYYYGESTSDLYDIIDKDIDGEKDRADSSTVKMSLSTLYGVYTKDAITVRAQGLMAAYPNANKYNEFINENDHRAQDISLGQSFGLVPDNAVLSDLPELLGGFYVEVAYDVLKSTDSKSKLSPFFRYEYTNSHIKVGGDTRKNPGYELSRYVTGFSWQPTNTTTFKLDYSYYDWNETNNALEDTDLKERFGTSEINLGVGFNLSK